MSDTPRPKVCGKSPALVDVPAGVKQAWCSCGHSARQPWCDGTHNRVPGGFVPVKFTLAEPARKAMCMCKASAKPPYCDGSHARLPG